MKSTQFHVEFKQTPVSNILKILIKICIIPLKINQSENTAKVTFKFVSKETLFFLLYPFIIFGSTFFMMFYEIGINTFLLWFITKFQNSNLIDFVSLMCIMNFAVTIPSFSLPFFKQLTRVAPEIILSQRLQLPSHWKKFVFASLLYTFSSFIYMFINIRFSKIENECIDYFWWIAGALIQNICVNIFAFIFFSIILCLIDEFKRIVSLRKDNIISHSNNCLNYFKTLQKGFGTTFLITFSFYQMENVFCTYMSISSIMSMNEIVWQNLVLSVCYFTMAAYFMTILYCFTLTAEEAYDALQSLNSPLEKMLVSEDDLTRKELIKITMRKLDKVQPLNGYGYFYITRETLTSIISTTITYLIILLQFR